MVSLPVADKYVYVDVLPYITCVFQSHTQNSPNNMSLSNQPGTPRDDGEMGGNFLNPFQSESVSVLYMRTYHLEETSQTFIDLLLC